MGRKKETKWKSLNKKPHATTQLTAQHSFHVKISEAKWFSYQI